MNTQKYRKLEEFVVNDTFVTSSSFGPKSKGQTLACGGADGSLSVWSINPTENLLVLPPLTSSVETIKFKKNEEVICAGASSGLLRVYDLAVSKVSRQLSGHKTSVRGIDFHPYGDFLVSCSDDHKVRLWDVRRKGCIYTYKQHTDIVNDVQFSPDGRWIAAVSDDHTCKIWDISAGRMLSELKQHSGPLKCLNFHPKEFLLTTGSSDRTSKVFDLEHFKLLSTTPLESNVIEKVSFSKSGEQIFTISQDCFKSYYWEPTCSHLDTVLVKWGRPSSIFVKDDMFLSCSHQQNLVSVHAIDLTITNNRPTSIRVSPPEQQTRPPTTRIKRQSSYSPLRSAFNTNHRILARSNSNANVKAIPASDQVDPVDKNLVFYPKKKLARSPTRGSSDKDSFKVNEDEIEDQTPSSDAADVPLPINQLNIRLEKDQQNIAPNPAAHAQPPLQFNPDPPTEDLTEQQNENQMMSTMIPMKIENPVGLDLDSFLPKVAPSNNQAKSLDDDKKVIDVICRGFDSMKIVLQNRQRNLKAVKNLWSNSNVLTAMKTHLKLEDQSLTVDLLNILNIKPSLWSLDLSLVMLPHIKNLISSHYESYVSVGCSTLRLILKSFSQVIRSNKDPPPSSAIDLSREERHQKCKQCYSCLLEIQSFFENKLQVPGKFGSQFRELKLLISGIE